jgi:hypothetical protein
MARHHGGGQGGDVGGHLAHVTAILIGTQAMGEKVVQTGWSGTVPTGHMQRGHLHLATVHGTRHQGDPLRCTHPVDEQPRVQVIRAIHH